MRVLTVFNILDGKFERIESRCATFLGIFILLSDLASNVDLAFSERVTSAYGRPG